MAEDSFSTVINDFKSYMRLERGFSPNTIAGYLSDCAKLAAFLEKRCVTTFEEAGADELRLWLEDCYREKLSKRSQARMLSAMKGLYRFLVTDGYIKENPCEKLSAPKIGRHLPDVLSIEEVTSLIDSVDLTKKEGQRDKAILDVLYSCGLRVSELVGLHISDVFFDEQFVRVMGKGSKQRLVPIGTPALKNLRLWMELRRRIPVVPSAEDFMFVNRRGGKLARVMVFDIVKRQAAAAGIVKEVSPHTLRHSFATALLEGGADLRSIQAMLGHEKIGTTEIYTHLDMSHLREDILNCHPRNIRYNETHIMPKKS